MRSLDPRRYIVRFQVDSRDCSIDCLLIIAIAVLALCFAILRSPFGFLVVLVAGVLPGYVIGRLRGGSGIIAGALSESACAAVLFIIFDLAKKAW
jgi:hypothetical protein